MTRTEQRRVLAIGQGVYLAATGVWPLIHMRSLEAVTGPKVDTWLVRTVGVLVTVIGGTLMAAGIRRCITPETVGLATGAAAGLGAVDVLGVGTGTISPVYLLDAAIEGALTVAWAKA
jgi:hypothetical protein